MPQTVPTTTISLGDQEVSTSTNATGEFSEIIDIQIPQGHRYEFPRGEGLSMYIPVHESFTVSASSTETKNLGQDLADSPTVRSVPQSSDSETEVSGQFDLVVWDDNLDIQTGVDSVDYDANTFTYDNTQGSDTNLEVYYLWKNPSSLEFRYEKASLESYDKQLIKTVREFHEGDVFTKEGKVTFSESFTLREKEHLKIVVNTDVDLANWDTLPSDASSPGTMDTHSYADISIPVRRVSTQ